MGENSKIEWTDHTFNPWIGCTKVAAGCTHCYAEAFSKRTGKAKWGEHGTRVKTSESYWRQPLEWDKRAVVWPLHVELCRRLGIVGHEACLEAWRAQDEGRDPAPDLLRRPRVFCASMADVFEDWSGNATDSKGIAVVGENPRIPPGRIGALNLDDIRARLFDLIDATPHLDWLLLTKRPENIRRMWSMTLNEQEALGTCEQHGIDGSPRRENVWLGTSIATQSDADKNIPELIKCRDLAPVLFVSAEPLLGPVALPDLWLQCTGCRHIASRELFYKREQNPHCPNCRQNHTFKVLGNIDWMIVGGESGHGARPMHPDWARGLRDQCQAAGVPFFFKQWGEFAPVPQNGAAAGPLAVPLNRKIKKSVILRADGDRSEYMPHSSRPDAVWMVPVGKESAGRLLDGREWNEFPQPATVPS